MITAFRIDRDVPVPAVRLYPFRSMQPGDSFAVPVMGETARDVQKRVTNSACAYGKRHGCKFTVRITGDTVRCWRVA